MKKILVIEDDVHVRTNLVDILKLEGFEVAVAENGEQGLALAKDLNPDLILCDVMMPRKNGYEVLTAIRNDSLIALTPFIFLTAKASKHDVREGMELGADDFLTKPFTIDELRSAVQTQLKKHEVMAQQMEELRSSLTFMLPHELLTPLNVILGFASILQNPRNLPPVDEIAGMGKAIYENGRRLQRLVENYLLYTELKLLDYKQTAHSIWRDPLPVETRNFLQDLSLTPAKRMNRQNDVTYDLEDTTIYVAPKAFVKILEELLDNAFKFSPAGSPVHLSSASNHQQFMLTVKDKGRGMTSEQIAKISAFMQFDRKKYEQQGAGLGLALVYRLAELNRGQVRIDSQPGQGTIVTVAFDQPDQPR
jgi:two-component system, sensor histidine kinase and response regulator